MTNKTQTIKTVNQLKQAGKSYSAIYGVIKTLYDLSKEEATEILAEAGVEKSAARKKSLNARIGDWLQKPRSEEEFKSWCEEEELNKTNIRYMRAIFEAMNAVHAKYQK